MKKFLKTFAADQSGAGAVEYSCIVALMTMVVLAAVANLGMSLEVGLRSIP